MDLDLDLDSIFNGFGSGFGFKCVLGLDWILDLKKFMDLDLDLDLFLDMDSNPNPRIQIRTSLVSRQNHESLHLYFTLKQRAKICTQLPRSNCTFVTIARLCTIYPSSFIHLVQ